MLEWFYGRYSRAVGRAKSFKFIGLDGISMLMLKHLEPAHSGIEMSHSGSQFVLDFFLVKKRIEALLLSSLTPPSEASRTTVHQHGFQRVHSTTVPYVITLEYYYLADFFQFFAAQELQLRFVKSRQLGSNFLRKSKSISLTVMFTCAVLRTRWWTGIYMVLP